MATRQQAAGSVRATNVARLSEQFAGVFGTPATAADVFSPAPSST
jgi:hypothetical protein